MYLLPDRNRLPPDDEPKDSLHYMRIIWDKSWVEYEVYGVLAFQCNNFDSNRLYLWRLLLWWLEINEFYQSFYYKVIKIWDYSKFEKRRPQYF